jgi:hypothetical protein
MAKGMKTGGRQKGTPNKVTADVRAAILAAFDKVGGIEYLAVQAHDNPAAFMTLLGKVLPTQVNHTGEVSHRYVMRAPTPVESAAEWLKQHSPKEMA